MIGNPNDEVSRYMRKFRKLCLRADEPDSRGEIWSVLVASHEGKVGEIRKNLNDKFAFFSDGLVVFDADFLREIAGLVDEKNGKI